MKKDKFLTKVKNYFNNITGKQIFSIIFGIWFIDFLTTAYFMNFTTLSEGNKIVKYFFSLGLIGWVITFFYAAFCYLIFTILIVKSRDYVVRCYIKDEKKYQNTFTFLIAACGVSMAFIAEFCVIVYNIYNILNYYFYL